MRAGTRFSLLVLSLWASEAYAQTDSEFRPGSLLLEVQMSSQGPLGPAGLALAYDSGNRFVLGVGMGGQDALDLFTRIRVLHRGPLSFGLSAGISRKQQWTRREYNRPHYAGEAMEWTWDPGFRGDLAATMELASPSWSLGLQAGIGYLLNTPKCAYYGGLAGVFEGNCNSPEIPSAYHFSLEPTRLVPSVTMTLGYHLDFSSGPQGIQAKDWGFGSSILTLVLADGLGLMTAYVGAALLQKPHSNNIFVGAALGVTIGVAAGTYLAGKLSPRPNGSFGMTLLGAVAGSLIAIVGTSYANDVENGKYTVFSAIALFSTLPVAGAAAIYWHSAPPPAPALVPYSPETEVLPNLPPVSLSKGNGIPTVNLPILSGRF